MPNHESKPTVLHYLIREPTLHFFVIAASIFALYSISRSGQENRLEIDQREIDARIFMQEMANGAELTEEQRQFVTSSFVEEQILVQEALAMGLDNDARIHDMLAQKMRHVLSGEIIQPSQGELEAFYQANAGRYQRQATLDVEELVLDSRDPLPPEFMSLLDSGADSAELLALTDGNSSPLPGVNRTDLGSIFDSDFADRVFAAPEGQWTGPFISNRGQHWLRTTSLTESRLPALDEIADRVRLDWIATEEDIRLQQQINQLWDEYSVIITNSEE